MNKRLLVTSITVVTITATAASVWADPPDCEQDPNAKEFLPTEGVWQLHEHWDPFGAPGPDDLACIENNRVAWISPGYCDAGDREGQYCNPEDPQHQPGCPGGDCVSLNPHVEVGAIKIFADGDIWVDIGTLTINQDSAIDGVLHGQSGGKLLVEGDVEITGYGGIIRGEWDYPYLWPPARIEAARRCVGGQHHGLSCYIWWECTGGECLPVTARLTIAPDPVQGDNSDPSTSLKVHEVWTIDVEFENNAYVISDLGSCRPSSDAGLVLQGGPKSGSGFWIATPRELGCGVLVINTEVDLNGASWTVGGVGAETSWRVYTGAKARVDPQGTFTNWTGDARFLSGRGPVEMNNPSFSVPGDLRLDGGTLAIIDDFTGTGNLLMFGGEITVAEGKTAEFH